MSETNKQSIRKFMKALLICFCLLLFVLGVEEVGKRGEVLKPSDFALVADGLFEGGENDVSRQFVASALGSYGGTLPESFTDELFDPGNRETIVSDEGPAIGVMYACDPEKAMEQVLSELASHGWTKVESGNPLLVSLVKETGTYRWAFVSADGGQEETCVTILLSSQES